MCPHNVSQIFFKCVWSVNGWENVDIAVQICLHFRKQVYSLSILSSYPKGYYVIFPILVPVWKAKKYLAGTCSFSSRGHKDVYPIDFSINYAVRSSAGNKTRLLSFMPITRISSTFCILKTEKPGFLYCQLRGIDHGLFSPHSSQSNYVTINLIHNDCAVK